MTTLASVSAARAISPRSLFFSSSVVGASQPAEGGVLMPAHPLRRLLRPCPRGEMRRHQAAVPLRQVRVQLAAVEGDALRSRSLSPRRSGRPGHQAAHLRRRSDFKANPNAELAPADLEG